MKKAFHKFAATVATASGTPWAFLLAFLVIVVWADHRTDLQLLRHLAARQVVRGRRP